MTRPLPRRFLLAYAATLAGCSVLPERPYQARREWPLQAPRPAVLARPPNGPVLLIRAMRAGPGLESRGLRTILPDGSEHLDDWEEWAVPPPQGVEDCLRQWLTGSGIFGAVVLPGSEAAPRFVLESELLAFAADRRTRTARATVSLVLLRRTNGGLTVPVLQQTVPGEVPLSGADAPSIAASLRAALASMLAQAERLLSAREVVLS